MTLLQMIMLAASAFFALKIYEHIQTLKDPEEEEEYSANTDVVVQEEKTAQAFSPFSADELIEKADSAYENEEFAKALALLHEADAKAPNDDEILFKIAFILQKSGDDQEALRYYKQALEVDKNNEFIHNAMATIYRKNKEFISAKMHLKASLDIDDQNAITYYNYGNLLVDTEHLEEAKAMYTRAIELDPDFEEAKVELQKLQG